MNKIYSFDALRFILALTIVLYHITIGKFKALPSGYLAVEIFFILSGFLLAKSYFKYKDNFTDKFDLFKKIILNKLRRLYPEYIFITLIVVFTYYFTLNINRFPDLFYNIILFGESGIARNVIDGSWFVSALFWATFFITFLMIRYNKTFFYILAPLLFFICVPPLYHLKPNTLMQIGQAVTPFITAGTLRAIAALCCGCILYYFYTNNKKIFQNKKVLITTGILGIFSIINIFYLMKIHPTKLLPYNIYFFGFLLILSLIVFDKYLKRLFNNKLWGYLSDTSYMLFLTNILVQQLMKKYIPYQQDYSLGLYYFIEVIVCILSAFLFHSIYKFIAIKTKPFFTITNDSQLDKDPKTKTTDKQKETTL